MKKKILLAVLALGAFTLSSAQQKEHEGIDSVKHEQVAQTGSTHAVKMSDHKNEMSGNQKLGLYAAGGICLLIGIFLIARLISSKDRKGSRMERLQRKQEEVILEEQIRSARLKAKVEQKRNAILKLGGAAATLAKKNGAKLPEWNGHKGIMEYISFLLEGKWFLRWNPKPFLWIAGSLATLGLVTFLILLAINQPKERIVTERVIVKSEPQPQPVVTPTVVPIEIEIPEKPVVYQKPEEGENVFYVEAPVGRYGETIFTPTGYEYDYWPEDNVYGLSEPNGTSVSFEYGPNFPLTNIGKSVAWASRTGYPVRIKVVKKWIGSGYGV